MSFGERGQSMTATGYHSSQGGCGPSMNKKSRSIEKKRGKGKAVLSSDRALDFLQQCFDKG